MRIAAIFFAASTASCSYILVDGPPQNHAMLKSFDCTTHRAPVVIDGIVAGAAALIATQAMLAASDAKFSSDRQTGHLIAALFGIDVAIYGSSMAFGAIKTSECREAKWIAEEKSNSR